MADNNSSEVEVLEEGPLAAIMQTFAHQPGEDPVIDEAFILDDKVVSSKDVLNAAMMHSMRCFDKERIVGEDMSPTSLRDVMKTVEGTSQSQRELTENPAGTVSLGDMKVIKPPYPPEVLSSFLEVDPTHFRCVKTKMIDAVGRDFTLEPTSTKENELFDSNKADDAQTEKAGEEVRLIRNFMQEANKILGFQGVLERVWMDYEAIGWGAVEVIRSADMKVRHFAHVPAPRVRVLRGWGGFVEIIGGSQFIYYQNFGDKVVTPGRESPITGKASPYNPIEDGDLSAAQKFNMIDRNTGEPTNDFKKSANELIWIPRHHSNTIYYGMTDVVPALGDLMSNVNIRDYVLQFFEHNTVPRYAIIIEGAKMAAPVQQLIMDYFNTHVKGKPHKTLIIPVPAIRGEVKVRFEKLDSQPTESSFQETRKNHDQHIMTSHGVSPAIIGISEASELGSGKGLSQAEIYKDRIVSPSQRQADESINKIFRLGLGVTMVELKHVPLDIRDLEGEQRYWTGYQDSGAVSINEVRLKTRIGDPIDGGDRPFIMTTKGIVFVDELPSMQGAGVMAEQEAERRFQDGQERMKMEKEIKMEQAKQPVQTIAPPASNGAARPAMSNTGKK